MPNHVHFILINVGPAVAVPVVVVGAVGADLRVSPYDDDDDDDTNVRPDITVDQTGTGEHIVSGKYIGSPLPRVVQW